MFNLGSLGALGEGFFDRYDKQDEQALNRILLQRKREEAAGTTALGTALKAPSALGQMFQQQGGGTPGISHPPPQAPMPGQASQPAPPMPQPQEDPRDVWRASPPRPEPPPPPATHVDPPRD